MTSESERVWTEVELKKAKLDEQAYSQHVYEEDEEYTLPCRFLTDWTCSRGDFPVDNVNYFKTETVVFTGRLLPLSATNTNNAESRDQGQEEANNSSSSIQIHQLRPSDYSIDRTPSCRGYWITTDHAYYWLHQPLLLAESENENNNDGGSSSRHHQHLAARAVLTCLSNILHYAFSTDDEGKSEEEDDDDDDDDDNVDMAKSYARRGIATVAAQEKHVDLKLAQAVGRSVAQHLIQAHPALTERCMFIRSLSKCGTATSAVTKDADWLLARCLKAEARLPQQTPWGQPCELLEEVGDDEPESSEDEKEKKEEATATPRSKRSRSRSDQRDNVVKRAKQATPKDDDDPKVMDPPAPPPAVAAASPSLEADVGDHNNDKAWNRCSIS